MSLVEEQEGFFDVSEVQIESFNPIINPLDGIRMYYQMKIRLAEETITHTRTVYGFMDLLAYLGGLGVILIAIIQMLLKSWVDFQYNLELLQRLYMVRTKGKLDYNFIDKQVNLEQDLAD